MLWALLLGYLMYRSGLVPRVIPVMGLIGGPLILAAGTVTLLGLNDQVSVWSGIVAAPIFAWEPSLGIWLIVKGFDPSVIASEKFSSRSDTQSPEIQGVGITQTTELQKTRT